MKLSFSSSTIPKIAVRNLLVNGRRSLLVCSIIAMCVVLSVVGNSFFESSGIGLRRTFVDSFTGDLFVSPRSDTRLSLFGDDTPIIGSYAPIPTLAHHREILEELKSQPEVSFVVSQVSGYAMVEALGIKSPVVLFGVNGDAHFEAFSGARILAGSRLRTGMPGIMVSLNKAEEIGRSAGRSLSVGDSILLSVFTNRGFSIREVPLAGIFQYPVDNAAFDRIAYVDVDTLRALNGMARNKVELRDLPPDAANFLEGDLSNVFDLSSSVKSVSLGIQASDVERALRKPALVRLAAAGAAGSWNFVLIKLKPEVDRRVFQRDLEHRLRALGLEARVADWRAAAGSAAAFAGSVSVAFNVGLVLLGIVIALILANVFYIWVIERTKEIATMRALGASRGFVVSLFFAESTLLSITSAVFGVLLCTVLVSWLSRRGFATSNRILMLVFGGSRLRPLLTWKSVATGILGAIGVAAVAILLPLRLALKLRPVRAMNAE